MPADLPLTGGCLCETVRFEVTAPLVSARYCHCTRCQKRTGTAVSAAATTAPGALRVLTGADAVRDWVPPAGGFTKAFCSLCGSHLWSFHPERPGVFGVRLGAFDGDPGIRPSARQFVANAAAWESIPDDGLPRYPGRVPSS